MIAIAISSEFRRWRPASHRRAPTVVSRCRRGGRSSAPGAFAADQDASTCTTLQQPDRGEHEQQKLKVFGLPVLHHGISEVRAGDVAKQ